MFIISLLSTITVNENAWSICSLVIISSIDHRYVSQKCTRSAYVVEVCTGALKFRCTRCSDSSIPLILPPPPILSLQSMNRNAAMSGEISSSSWPVLPPQFLSTCMLSESCSAASHDFATTTDFSKPTFSSAVVLAAPLYTVHK